MGCATYIDGNPKPFNKQTLNKPKHTGSTLNPKPFDKQTKQTQNKPKHTLNKQNGPYTYPKQTLKKQNEA